MRFLAVLAALAGVAFGADPLTAFGRQWAVPFDLPPLFLPLKTREARG
jgi:hypothetical protein